MKLKTEAPLLYNAMNEFPLKQVCLHLSTTEAGKVLCDSSLRTSAELVHIVHIFNILFYWPCCSCHPFKRLRLKFRVGHSQVSKVLFFAEMKKCCHTTSRDFMQSILRCVQITQYLFELDHCVLFLWEGRCSALPCRHSIISTQLPNPSRKTHVS